MSKKREPRAGERRRPRSPVVSEEHLKQHKDAISDQELWQLTNRFEELERLRKAGALNTPFIALEALGALSGGLVSGRSEEQLQTAWPVEWGQETITVPLALILSLREAWNDYRQAVTGKTLGEALQIEGGAQGNHPMKAKLATIDRRRLFARQVTARYLRDENDKKPLSVEDAIRQVAEENSISYETVKDAWRQYGQPVISKLEDLGVVKGVKGSRS